MYAFIHIGEKKLNYLTELIPSSLICLKKDLVPEKTYFKA